MSASLKQPTVSRLAKAKKPLSDMHQLQRAVKELQREAADQLVLEVESQATFEFLTSQIRALKSAFDTLSDVLLNEIDGVRKDTHRKLSEMDALVTRQIELHKATHSEVLQLKRTMEVWALKERDWAKDNEILKASHAHNIEWMQQLQRDVMDVKDRSHEFKSDVSYRLTDVVEQTASLRGHWQAQVDDMTDRLQTFELTAQRQTAELRAVAQQRMDDLALTEQALSSVQKQQLAVRSQMENCLQTTESQQVLLAKQLSAVDSQCTTQRVQIDQLRTRHSSLEQEQRRRMETISKTFSVRHDKLSFSCRVCSCALS